MRFKNAIGRYNKPGGVAVISSPTLATLTLSGILTNGSSSSGTILGATTASTIVSNVAGLTINSALRTYTWDGTGAAGATSNGLVETLSGATGSPKSSSITVAAAAGGASPSYIGPQLTPQASATTYPPQPLLTTNAYHPVGAKLRVRAASTYANLIAGTSLLVDDASFTLTANPTTNQNGLWAKLAGIASGKTFIDVRVEESSTVFSERSVAIMHGSSSVPAPQASIDFSVYSTFPLSGAITFAEPVYLTILGDDQISLELSGAQPGTSFTLRWLDNVSKNYDPTQPNGNNDFNVDHIYDYILRRRSLADVTADSAGAVTLLDYDTTPDAFSFTPVTGATTSALVPLDSTVFSGMAAGYGAPLTLSGAWEKFKIDQGSGFGADITSTSGITLQDGWDLRVYVRASASYLTLARAIVTVGGVSANADVTTLADPSSVSPTFNNFDVANYGTDFPATSTHSLYMTAGVNVVAFYAGAASSGADCAGATSITLAARTGVAEKTSLWEVVVPTSGFYNFRKLGSGGFVDAAAASINLAGAVSGVLSSAANTENFRSPPMQIGSGTTVPAGGLAIMLANTQGPTAITWGVGVGAKAGVTATALLSIGYMTSTGIPTYIADSFYGDGGVAAVWSH